MPLFDYSMFAVLPLPFFFFYPELLQKNTLVKFRQHKSYLVRFTNYFVTIFTQTPGALGVCHMFESWFNPEQHTPWHLFSKALCGTAFTASGLGASATNSTGYPERLKLQWLQMSLITRTNMHSWD